MFSVLFGKITSKIKPTSKKKKKINRYLKSLGNFIALAVLAYFVYSLSNNSSAFFNFAKNLKPKLLISSIFILVIGQAVKLELSLTSLRLVQPKMTRKEAYKVWFLSQIGKYIPGGFWPYLTRAYLYKTKGLKVTESGALVVLESGILFTTNIFLGIPSIFLLYQKINILTFVSTVVIIAILTLRFRTTISRTLKKILQIRIFNKKLKKHLNIVSIPLIKRLTLTSLISSVIIAVGFYILLNSMPKIHVPVLPGLFVFPMAWAVGFLIVFAPVGLGPRELALAFLLGSYYNHTELAFMLVLSRLWWSAGDAVNISIALLMQLANIPKANKTTLNT